MKKIKIILNFIIGLTVSNLEAQQQEINFGNFSRPVSSVSSLATYTNVPISIAIGTPNTSIPLLELPSKSKNISAPIFLSYNPMNVKESEPASDVGTGWSLFAGGVISREVIGSLNEASLLHDFPDNPNEEKFNDIFYYNLSGISGKFKFNKDIDNTINIINLSPNKVKISYIRDFNSPYFTIKSFTITDENGYKYVFSDYSESTSNSFEMGTYLYRSAFFLTEIKLPDNTTIINFEYRKDSKHSDESPTSDITYKSCKLIKINSEGIGSININYLYDSTKENTMNDPYSITQIFLKNTKGDIISGYKLNYSTMDLYNLLIGDSPERKGRRFLDKLIKLNKNLIEDEKTSFTYNPYQSQNSNNNPFYCNPSYNYHNYGDYNIPGLLKRIITAAGGVTEYNFEPHDFFVNKSSPEYLENMLIAQDIEDPDVQYIGEYVPVLNIDTNQNLNYDLSISGDPSKKKRVSLQLIIGEYYPPGIWVPDPASDPNDSPDPNNPGGNPGGHYHFDLTFTLKKDGVIIQNDCGHMDKFNYYLYPGNYTVVVSGTGGKGKILLSEIKLKNPPYFNKTVTYKYGPRIKNIKHYRNNTDLDPVKTEVYNYAQFNDSNSSSGYIFRNESEQDNISPGYVLYKNVMITDGENGYTRYYYKTPDDYPKTAYTVNGENTTLWHYYTIVKSGILDKKEIYNSQNMLLSSTENDFTFETLDNLPHLKINGFEGFPTKYTKPAFIKNTKAIIKDYADNNQYVENKIETVFNPSNFKIASIKETSSEGTLTEKWMRYAFDKGNTRLVDVNIISQPLEVETKVNGKLIEKVETRYDNTTNFYPSSVIANNPNDGSIKTIQKYETFDTYGNIRQFAINVNDSTGSEVPTTIIWGYNQTLPIAKIEGAKISDIGNLADESISKSNLDIDTSSENALINALDAFRVNMSLKNFQITTYTYDPLVGATTLTHPNGLREIYKYDQNNRLKALIDVNGNIIKEYKYNIKTQP